MRIKTLGLSIEEHELIQKELKILADAIEELKGTATEIKDPKAEFQGFQTVHGKGPPRFQKKQFPEIMKKVGKC